MTSTTAAETGVLDRSAPSSLADVVETILDKGLVIDAQVTVGVVGIPLVEINARVVVASIETYLRFAEAVDRLTLTPREGPGLGGLVEDVTGGARQLTSGLAGSVRDVGGVAEPPVAQPDRTTGRPRSRRRSAQTPPEEE